MTVDDPFADIGRRGDEIRAKLSGCWDAAHAAAVEKAVAEIVSEATGVRQVLFDLAGVRRLDTLGAWVLDRTRHELGQKGLKADFLDMQPEHLTLLNEVACRGFQELPAPARTFWGMDFLVHVGQSVTQSGRDLYSGVSFLGEVVAALFRILVNPRRFRPISVVHHVEMVGLHGVPIVSLISFLVGCIVAQQGLFQLQRFGAQAFVVNLIGILTLRELCVLLTSIMIAGRSGSAFTAELGSMKMREEVDALRVMGLDPIEVLVVPRIAAIIIALPLLTFVSAMAGLFGGGLVSWLYGGIPPEIFLARLKQAISMSTFLVGMIKAPFMALVIGVIATQEGLQVKGSAESLGRQVTSSVVKAIFMVIVVDGLFAMFFAAIDY
ncbi:MlaE family ABC transporter permease [Camelimonas abortus]|uniref:MlaE family ABC transporter permease n=1 Tax=Camelimonas abortus TaxID=1017184 RepID=A0ABV7LH91_9HYPH